MTDDAKKPQPKIHPELLDDYACVDCEFTWKGDEMDCPKCGSTRTGLLVPRDEDMH